MKFRSPLAALWRDQSGSVVVEFAMLAPALLTLLLGVFQVGIAMQNYNALRGISGDVSRYAVVNYQNRIKLTTSQIEDYAGTVASGKSYGLTQTRFSAEVTKLTTSRVEGADELNVTLSYRVPSFLELVGIDDIAISFNRPIFLVKG